MGMYYNTTGNGNTKVFVNGVLMTWNEYVEFINS